MPYAVASTASVKIGRPAAGDQTRLENERDAAWVVRAGEGDAEAFRCIVEHYQERACRIALSVLGNREEACDVAQEAFLRVYRSLHRFQLGQSFYTWLYRIVVNLSIDQLRKRNGDRHVALEDLGDALGVHAPPGHDLDQRELMHDVRAALDLLPSKYKVVLVLRDIEEMGCWEIARITGCTHATARWRLHKARRMFRDIWERRLRRSHNGSDRTDLRLAGGEKGGMAS